MENVLSSLHATDDRIVRLLGTVESVDRRLNRLEHVFDERVDRECWATTVENPGSAGRDIELVDGEAGWVLIGREETD